MGKLLSIETGFTCNSRCRYCTQLDYRVIPQADKLDLDTEAIKERIRYGAQHGYDQVGFSGGEPTIRPDFIELVRYARTFDFERIGVTTNGRMFAYRRFTRQAVAAGLDGFTFSLHGHTPAVHDRIASSPGALEQALAGLRHIVRVSREQGRPAHLMNNQILLPDNTPHIKEMVDLLAPLGVRLFMIQPFIAQRSNSDELGRFFVPYDEIVEAVRRALPALEAHGARIKPYNVPNCLLWRFGERYVEPQFYGLRSFREYEARRPGEFRAFRARQWYRIPECEDCEEHCPGFRIEHYPQARMADALVRAAQEATPVAPGGGPVIFSGTELFDAATIRDAFARIAAVRGPVSWMTALCEKVQRPEQVRLVAELCEAGWLDSLVLITQPMDQRFLAQRVLEKGNLEELRAGLFMLAEQRDAGRRLPKLRVLFNVGDILRLLEESAVPAQWPKLLRSIARATGQGTTAHEPADAVIAISNFPRDDKPPDMRRQRERNLVMAGRIRAACEAGGLRPVLATLEDRRGLDPARAEQMAIVEAQFAEILPLESWAGRLFRHPFSRPEMDFVSWSPPWLFERWDLSDGGLPEGVIAQPGDRSRPGLREVAVAEIAGPRASRR